MAVLNKVKFAKIIWGEVQFGMYIFFSANG